MRVVRGVGQLWKVDNVETETLRDSMYILVKFHPDKGRWEVQLLEDGNGRNSNIAQWSVDDMDGDILVADPEENVNA